MVLQKIYNKGILWQDQLLIQAECVQVYVDKIDKPVLIPGGYQFGLLDSPTLIQGGKKQQIRTGKTRRDSRFLDGGPYLLWKDGFC
jgi:hypothetical protein